MPDDRPETTAGATATSAAAASAAQSDEAAGAAPVGDPAGPPGRPAGTRTWWFVAPAFVLGLFAGAVTLGLIREDPPPVPAPASEAPSGSDESPSDGDAPTPGASAEITVNEACLRVVNGTQDLVEIIGDLGGAAADLDISGLNQAIRRLQPLEGRLRDDLEDCETDTTLPGDLSPRPATEEPSASPSAPSTTAPPD